MMRYLGIMMTISSVFLMKIGDEESCRKKDEIWEYLKNKDKRIYKKISRTMLGCKKLVLRQRRTVVNHLFSLFSHFFINIVANQHIQVYAVFYHQPLPYVKTMYYMDLNLYRYFIGREDQSVNENNMMKRIGQQLAVFYHAL